MAATLALDPTTYANTGGGTKVILNKPANVADGDTLFAAVVHRTANGTWTGPAGWTEIGVSSEDYCDVRVYYKRIYIATEEVVTTYTWQTSQAIERAVGVMWRQTNVNPSQPIDAFGAALTNVANASTMSLPAVTAISDHAMLIGIQVASRSTATPPPDPTLPTSMAELGNTVATNPGNSNSLRLKVVSQTLSASGTTGTRDSTLSPVAGGRVGFLFTITPLDTTPAPQLVALRQGLPDSTSVRVASLTHYTTSGVRLAVSTSAAMTSPVYSSLATPDTQGYAKHIVTGLSPDTNYFYAVELDGVLKTATVGKSRTFPSSGKSASFSFISTSCTSTGSNHTIFDVMRTRIGSDSLPARFFVHLGDLHYEYASFQPIHVAPDDPPTLRSNYELSMQQARQAALFRDIPLSHTYSDNDFGGTNSDDSTPARASIIAARRQVIMDPPLTDSEGIYRSWVVGRVRFIQTDSRSFMSPRGDTDNASKSMLGATQKAWLKARLLDTEPVKIWLHDNQWLGPAVTNGTIDTWQAFSTERTEIGNFISSNNVKMVYIHGDSHTLNADSGANNSKGGFATLGASPIDQTMNVFGEPVSNGIWPSASATGHLYGWFDVTDTGGIISLAFHGYDETGAERVSYTKTWNIARNVGFAPFFT